MPAPEHILSAVLAAGVAACFAYGYLAGRDTGWARRAATIAPQPEADDLRSPTRARHRTSARQLRTGRPTADRSPGTARPHARRRPRRRANRNP